MFPILSPSSIRSLFQSPLRHPLADSSNLVFAIDSITSPDLLFITDLFAVTDPFLVIDSLTVADVRFFIEDSRVEKRQRRSKKERERNEFIKSNRIRKALKAEDRRGKREKVNEGT
jgi:hypothetical protein